MRKAGPLREAIRHGGKIVDMTTYDAAGLRWRRFEPAEPIWATGYRRLGIGAYDGRSESGGRP